MKRLISLTVALILALVQDGKEVEDVHGQVLRKAGWKHEGLRQEEIGLDCDHRIAVAGVRGESANEKSSFCPGGGCRTVRI
jgi:hypothetical protein